MLDTDHTLSQWASNVNFASTTAIGETSPDILVFIVVICCEGGEAGGMCTSPSLIEKAVVVRRPDATAVPAARRLLQ
jgi:hypothetical protein